MTRSEILSVVAIVIAVVAVCMPRNASPAPPPPAADTALAERVDRLAQELEQWRAQPATVAPGEPVVRTEVSSEMLQRLAAVEQRLEQLAARQTAAGTPAGTARAPSPEDSLTAEQRRATWTTTFTDPRQTEQDRVRALAGLRGAGKGARGGAVADAAIQIVQSSTDAKIRADVWRQMSGAMEPVLVPHLIQSLQYDTDESVRDEAAETLEDYRDRPEVVAALRAASASDASEKVRRRAERSLAGGR